MALYRDLLAIAADQHGLFTVQDVVRAGASPTAVVKLAARHVIDRLSHGIYRIPELAGDRFAQYQEALLLCQGSVLSHDTALDLHELCDINPTRLHVTLPTSIRTPRRSLPAWLEIHRRRIEEGETTYVEGLAIVTPARAILDGIEANLGQRFIDEALAAAQSRNLLSKSERRQIDVALAAQRLRQLTKAEQ